MGDRGNIFVKDHGAGVYLYTHWDGYSIGLTLRDALARRLRWTDGPYLTRIIFCELVKHDLRGENGYGISSHICDNEYNILEVDPENKTVKVWQSHNRETVLGTVSFAEFAEFTDEQAQHFHETGKVKPPAVSPDDPVFTLPSL